MQAKLDGDGIIIGYTTTRKKAYPESVKEIEKKYIELSGKEYIDHKFFKSAELYHGEGIATRA